MDGEGCAKASRLRDNLRHVIKGKDEVIELLLTSLFAGGNVLMEDVPGVGKTTLAKALALSIGGHFNRLQFTPDLMPSDILGCSIYNPKDGLFTFRRGPVFTNILLADEINRASPRTQSALLEAMNEDQVSIEGITHSLPTPFMVLATQNPVEYYGTYPLPEAQLDRFAMELTLGYPSETEEADMLRSRRVADPIAEISPVIDCHEICASQEAVKKIEVSDAVSSYMLAIVRATRSDQRVKLGASPRALLTLSRCTQARAWLQGRQYTLPEDVKAIASATLAHRLTLENRAKHSGVLPASIIADTISRTPVPV